jgi:hypothetical protein
MWWLSTRHKLTPLSRVNGTHHTLTPRHQPRLRHTTRREYLSLLANSLANLSSHFLLKQNSSRCPSLPQCSHVNTKNWYRKETDLWAEFGKETPFGRKFSSKDSIKIPAVGSTPSFGRRAVCT